MRAGSKVYRCFPAVLEDSAGYSRPNLLWIDRFDKVVEDTFQSGLSLRTERTVFRYGDDRELGIYPFNDGDSIESVHLFR